jgi:hypothetical protein
MLDESRVCTGEEIKTPATVNSRRIRIKKWHSGKLIGMKNFSI